MGLFFSASGLHVSYNSFFSQCVVRCETCTIQNCSQYPFITNAKISKPNFVTLVKLTSNLRWKYSFVNSAPGFIMLSFEFNFLFIKSSVGRTLVVLSAVILYVNKNVFSFLFKPSDPSIFLKVFSEVFLHMHL